MEIDLESINFEETVEKLQNALHAKAKKEPGSRFYSLWDKVYRNDVMHEAYKRCRKNRGSAGVDGITFEMIEADGVEAWLGNLREELRSKVYKPEALLRKWIPKANGSMRPLGIPTIKDRVVQMAMLIVVQPIFETDLQHQQYGFRPGLDAKMAVRRVFFHIKDHDRSEIVDADLSDYFNTIPHGKLMKCIARRISDKAVLKTIKMWLEAPVAEKNGRQMIRRAYARRTHRGTPQGGVISPLLANIYFRRFILAWRKFGFEEELDAHIVNYADDMVICCQRGMGAIAMQKMRRLIERMGLTVNEAKTRLARLPGDNFDFLGYTLGWWHGREGARYFGTRPSAKAVKAVKKKIHNETTKRWLSGTPEKRVVEINRILRGWSGYFNQGPVQKEYEEVRKYTEMRLRRWLTRKHKYRTRGTRRFPFEYLYNDLGLFLLNVKR